MSTKVCRLCFEEKSKTFGIFAVDGIELDLATMIRLHFAAEVSEDDELPKCVCTECWTEVQHFHKFYESVKEATMNHIGIFVKIEEPSFVEDSCDAVDFDDNADSMETEPLTYDGHTDNNEPLANGGSSEDSSDRVNEFGGHTEETNSHVETLQHRNVDDESEVKPSSIFQSDAVGDTINFDKLIPICMNMQCDTCQHPFGSLSEATRHYKRKHKRRSVSVNCCQRKVLLKGIRDHIRYHLDPNTFKCIKCGKIPTSRRELRIHDLIHLPKRFECDICNKKFTVKSDIRNHIIGAHASDRPRFECEVCKKCFVTKPKLELHVKQVHDKYYQSVCHVCAKMYRSRHSLALHLRTHSDIKQPRSMCQLCGKSFKDAHTMKQHVNRIHESEQVQCPHCPKISPNRNALNRHIQSIHNYVAHKCPHCDREFKRAVALREHIAMHNGKDLYNCAYCPKTFRSNSNKYSHYRQHHSAEWDADKISKQQ